MNKNYFRFLYLIAIIAFSACNTPKASDSTFNNLKIEIEDIESPTGNSIRGISAVDSNIIWLSGSKGTILKSTNGGLNWEQLEAPDNDSLDFRSVLAFSASSAIIVSAGFPARAYRTKDGGSTWNLVYENKDSAAFMNSIAFKNEREGIIMGDQLKGRHLILRTGDGGETWKRIDSVDVPKPLKVENAFAASGSCIAVSKSGRFFIGFGGEETRIFSSVNGYKWKAKTTPFFHGEPTNGIYSIAASGSGKIMGVGGDYTQVDSSRFPIISTTDGKSWVKTKGKTGGFRSIVDYSAKGKFWVCGGTNGLEMSTDDGKSWTKFSFQNINTLRFLPKTTTAIGASSKGEIVRFKFQLKD